MNSETPVKDILDGEVEAENTVELEAAEAVVEEETAANDEVVVEESEEITETEAEVEVETEAEVEVEIEAEKKEIEYSPVVNAMVSKKAIAPFIVGCAAVCLMVLGYLMMWIFNLAAPNVGAFAIAVGMTKTFFGRFLVTLVHSAVLASAIVAIVAFIKIMVKGKAGIAKNIKNINILNSCMHMFALFSVVDMGVIFVLSVLKHNHYAIKTTLSFMGYSGLKYGSKVEDIENTGTIRAIIYALICIAAPIVLVISYNAIKDYFKKLENSANGAQFDKGNKSPAVFALIAAGLNFVFALVAFISGVFVDGVIYLANTAYMVGIAVYAMSVHKDLLKTSFD